MLLWSCVFACALAGCGVFAGHGMTGQPYAVPLNSTRVRSAVRFAVGEMNRANANELFTYRILNITSSRIQVVSGLKFILEVQLGQCERRDTVETGTCVYQFQSEELWCHFVVKEIPWKNVYVLARKDCKSMLGLLGHVCCS